MQLLHQGVDLANELASLVGYIHLHGVVRLQGAAKMDNFPDPWKWISIQSNMSQIEMIFGFLRKDNTLGFGLIRVGICPKFQVFS